jgi:hypothetical protein
MAVPSNEHFFLFSSISLRLHHHLSYFVPTHPSCKLAMATPVKQILLHLFINLFFSFPNPLSLHHLLPLYFLFQSMALNQLSHLPLPTCYHYLLCPHPLYHHLTCHCCLSSNYYYHLTRPQNYLSLYHYCRLQNNLSFLP